MDITRSVKCSDYLRILDVRIHLEEEKKKKELRRNVCVEISSNTPVL